MIKLSHVLLLLLITLMVLVPAAAVPLQYSWADKQYMIELNKQPDSLNDCVSFYNETFICFVDELPESGSFRGASVMTVERNAEVQAYRCATTSAYNLDFISRKNPHQRTKYTHAFDDNQPAVEVYVVDSYLDVGHREFGGRAVRGPSFNSGNKDAHGTHVAGLIAGSMFGVNKNARIIGIQVLDDQARGSWSQIARGMEYVAKQKPSIVNLSIGGGGTSIIDKVMRLMSKNGWKIVAAAGNEDDDACDYSPARSPEGVTVGATTVQMSKASFSNYGKCVDLLAPGDAIVSAFPNNRYAYMSGTSMAAPLVAGIWSLHPEWSREDLLKNAQPNIVSGFPKNTPNIFAYQGQKQTCSNPLLLQPFF